MISPDWLATDPISSRASRKGWTPRPNGQVKLHQAWASPEMLLGAGQDEIDPGAVSPPPAVTAPPVRDDWRLGQPTTVLPSSTAEPVASSPALETEVGSPGPSISHRATASAGVPEPAAGTRSPSAGPATFDVPVAPRESMSNWGEDLVPRQFADKELSAAEASAACGPAAAVAFARATGRNPTLREAQTLAEQRGLWAGGMKGPASEVALMNAMNIPAALGSDREDNIQTSLGRGDIVSVSTPNHYFVLDQFDPQSGLYHVGNSGTVYKAGRPWMTMQQIRNLGGGVNGVIYLDHPLGDAAPYPDDHPIGRSQVEYPKGVTSVATPGASSGAPSRAPSGTPADDFRSPTPASQRSPDREPQVGNTPVAWFSYVDDGQEVMQITWDTGQTTFHPIGQAQGEAGTVLQTGSLGVGQDEADPGQGDDQTEWDVPPTGSVHTTTPAQAIPTRDDWSRESTTSTSPVPSTDSASSRFSDTSPGTDPSSNPLSPPGSSGLSPSERRLANSTTQPSTLPPEQSPTSTNSASPDEQTSWEVPGVKGLQSLAGGIGNLINPDPSKLQSASAPGMGFDPSHMGEHAPINQPVELPDITQSPLMKPPTTDTGEPGTSPFAKMARGENLTPTEQIAAVPEWTGRQMEAQTEAATNINPARDVPVLGGAIEQSVVPENWFPVEKLAGLAKPVLGLAKPALGKLAEATPAAMKAAGEKLWDPLTHTYGAAWDKLMPDSISSQVPASVSAGFALHSAEGAVLGGGSMALATDPNDPNYWPKIAVAGTAGAVGIHVALHITPEIIKEWNKVLEPTANLKSKGVRESVAARANRLLGSGGEGHLWRNRIEEVLGKPGEGDNTRNFQMYVEENGHAPPGSSPVVQKLVSDMLQYTKDTGDEGRALKYIFGEVTNRVVQGPGLTGPTRLAGYMPRVLKKHLNAAKEAPGIWAGKLNPRDDYSHMREHLFLKDAVASGVEYVDNVSQGFGHYAEHVNASRANALFIKDLKRLAPETIVRAPQGKMPQSLAGKGWVRGDSFGIQQWQNVAFAPELKAVLEHMTTPSKVPNWPGVGGALNLFSEAKHAMFAPSLFHLMNEERQVFNAVGAKGLPILPKSLYYAVHPGAVRKYWASPQTMQTAKEALNSGLTLFRGNPETEGSGIKSKLGQRAVQTVVGGVTGGSAGYTNARMDPTLTDQQRLERAFLGAGLGAAGGMIGGTVSKALWNNALPVMKLSSWTLMRHSLGDQAAASYINMVYGGQNLEAIARSKTVQDVLRLAVLAPDWQEGWFRQIGNALIPHGSVRGSIPLPGIGKAPTNIPDANRQYWIRAAVTSAFMLEGLNVLMAGHPSWENGPNHELTLETTNFYDQHGWDHTDPQTGEKYRTYVDLLGAYRGLIQAPADPGKFAASRIGLLPSEGATLMSGKDWRGKPLIEPGEDTLKGVAQLAAYALSRIAPVGPSEIVRVTGQKTGEPLPVEVGQAVFGLRESRMSPLQVKLAERDKAYREHGISQEQEHTVNNKYLGDLRRAERDTEKVFSQTGKTQGELVTDAQHVNWPNRLEEWKGFEPTQIAADPVKDANYVSFIRGLGPVGVSSSEAPADINWSEQPVDVATIQAEYWSPPATKASDLAQLDPAAQDRIREAAIVSRALSLGVDPNAVRDAVKAAERGEKLQPIPGVSSTVLDQWVSQYRGATGDDPHAQSEARRQVIDDIASQYHVSPDAVYQRIKLRNLPLRKEDPDQPDISPEEKQRRTLQTSYERGQDVLYQSRAPSKYPKYANPDGTPYKGSGQAQWQSFDDQIKADTKKSGKSTHTPEVQALIDAKQIADAKRLKDIYASPDNADYQRWYGVGRNMTPALWDEYVVGKGEQFTDLKAGQFADTKSYQNENRRRTRTLELWKASTPTERKTTQVKIKAIDPTSGKLVEEPTTLDQAKKHIERNTDPRWQVHLALDIPGYGVTQSEAQP